MMALSLLLTLISLTGALFEVRPLNGAPIRGELSKLDANTLELATAAGPNSYRLKDVARVSRVDGAAKQTFSPPPVTLHLTDESTWKLASIRLADGKLSGKDLLDKGVSPRLRAAKAIRLKVAEGALDAPWEEYLAAKRETDALIVRRTIQRKAEDGETVLSTDISLDEIDGKLVAITETNVQFEVEGEPLDIPLSKVEGVILAIPAEGETPELVCVAVDAFGSRFRLQSASIEGETLKMTAVCGVAIELPLSQLSLLDFSASNTRYLSDMEMVESETHPYLDDSFTGAKLAKLLAPKRDRAFFGGQLEGGDSPFGDAKGLSLVAFTRVRYRIPKGFSRFSAVAALDGRVKKVGGVQLRILVDDKPLFEKLIDGQIAGETIEFELPPQARMLAIEADFGPRKELGASLQLRGARLTK